MLSDDSGSDIASPSNVADEEPTSSEAVDVDAVERVRAMTLDDIAEADAFVMEGVRLVFNNKIDVAESYFLTRKTLDPMCALAYGCIAHLRAMMSFAHDDIEAAMERLGYAYKFAAQVLPQRSLTQATLGMVTKVFSRKAEDPLSPAVFRASVVKAEAELLRGCLHLLQESVKGYVRAGLALRRGYNMYDSLQKRPERESADPNSQYGLRFGIGMIHSVLSMMPPKILKLIAVLGYMHDRMAGEAHLEAVMEHNGIRAPLASMHLMIVHGCLPSFANPMIPRHIPIAMRIAEHTARSYPDSCIHCWLFGRVVRMHRKVEDSLVIFQKSIDGIADQKSFAQLRHLAVYEMAWSHCFLFDWKAAYDCFDLLQRESSWSKAFYCYAAAACLEQVGEVEAALARYLEAPTHIRRKFAGKTISVEQYVRKKCALIESVGVKKRADGVRPTLVNSQLAVVELMFMFNCMPQMPLSSVERVVEMCDAATASGSFLHQDEVVVVRLLKACALRELGDLEMSRQLLDQISYEPKLEEATWVQPYALYEHASLEIMHDNVGHGQKLLKKLAKQFGSADYNFEMQLGWRVHLTHDLLKHQK